MKRKYARQSFLGNNAQRIIETCVVGIVGLGGGGSHIVQQLAHLGFKNYVLYDEDYVDETNLNRLVGATIRDINKPKIEISKRVILGLIDEAKVDTFKERWQNKPLPLRRCDIIFGCIDGFSERAELEACSRRFLIPYIDIGIDVTHVKPQAPIIAGQVILSMPGYPCMFCMGFLNDEKLSREAMKYGAAGDRPQVVWANGIVASFAVGVAVDIITGWTKKGPRIIYLSYEGNENTVATHPRVPYADKKCLHYPMENVGEPVLKRL
jgi:hypothetical protein